jgi:hypothetical protein
VLFGMPPSEFLDPVFAMMARGKWDDVIDEEGHMPMPIKGGHYMYGLPLGGSGGNYIATRPTDSIGVIEQYKDLLDVWNILVGKINLLVSQGVPIVLPAGDVSKGSKPQNLQTVFGVANLPQVITVGAADGDTVPAQSARGPAFDVKNPGYTEPPLPADAGDGYKALRIKPDLVAPSGVVGLLPLNSLLGKALSSAGVLDGALKPLWKQALETPTEAARAVLDTTLTSAAVVAAEAAGLRAKGASLDTIRGALNAAAEPLPGVPVWQQGAGLLRSSPDKFVDGTGKPASPLVIDHGDLAMNPATGTSAGIMRVTGTDPATLTGTLEVTDVATVAPDGMHVSSATATAATAVAEAIECTAPGAGVCLHVHVSPAGSAPEGFFCGFITVNIALFSEPSPLCLLKGMGLTAHATYLGDTPADSLTFALIPTLPIGAPFEHILTEIPAQHALELYFQETDKQGDAKFGFVLPGFYDVRLFSDYGAPVQVKVPGVTPPPFDPDDSADIGDPMIYQSLGQDALILPERLCPRASRPNCAPGFSATNYDPSTHTYKGTFLGAAIRFIFGELERIPGAAIGMSAIDVIKCRDLSQSDPGKLIPYLPQGTVLPEQSAWQVDKTNCDASKTPVTDADKTAPFSATYPGTLPGTAPFLVLDYQFRIPSPNYRFHLSLDFSYALSNSVVLVEVLGGHGPEKLAGIVAANGTLVISKPDLNKSLTADYPQQIAINAGSDSRAHFDFTRVTENGPCACLVRFILVPKGGLAGNLPGQVKLRDISIHLDSWVPWHWDGGVAGSKASLRTSPKFSTGAYSDGCRNTPTPQEGITETRTGTPQCEDWVLMAHIPTQGAVLGDIVACGTDPACGTTRSILASAATGSTFYDIPMDPSPAPAHWARFGDHEGHHYGHADAFVPEVVEVHKEAHCITSGRGKFWRLIAMRPAGMKAAGIGLSETIAFAIKFVPAGTEATAQPAALAKTVGGVDIAPYYPLAKPATDNISIAAPPNRLLLILGLIAATIAAAILSRRWRRRWSRS